MKATLEGLKVLTSKEMARIETLSIEAGASSEAYMLKAGEGIAHCTETFIEKRQLGKCVTLLVGKGNNGGDAFVAGIYLLSRGYHVEAYHIALPCASSPLCQQYEKAFVAAKGVVHRGEELLFKGVIIDGLLGTGVHGELQADVAKVVCKANDSMLPILSIDIPSGVNGNSGRVEGEAIHAQETISLGLPKLGCFWGEGYNRVGKLRRVDFGIETRFLDEAKESAYLINHKDMKTLLPEIKRVRHKYEAGYVIALAGSPGMPGAGMLSCSAALRTGAGIVRLFHPAGMEGEFFSAPYELIRSPYQEGDPTPIFKEEKRATAALIGPGIGRGQAVHTFAQQVVNGLSIPCVIDADGLFHIKVFPKGAILTPHHGEMALLLGGDTPDQERCQNFADQNEVTVVLKGAPTWIYHPRKAPIIVPYGDPGMATAGTGDVLAGMIAALLSQKVEGRVAAALGVYLHAKAGEIAAKEKSSYGMIASDLIDVLPAAFSILLKS